MIKKICSYILGIAFLGSGVCFHPIYAQAQMQVHEFEDSAQHELVCSQKECFDCCQSHDINDEVSLQKPGKEEDEVMAPALTSSTLFHHSADVLRFAFVEPIQSKLIQRESSYYLHRLFRAVVKRE